MSFRPHSFAHDDYLSTVRAGWLEMAELDSQGGGRSSGDGRSTVPEGLQDRIAPNTGFLVSFFRPVPSYYKDLLTLNRMEQLNQMRKRSTRKMKRKRKSRTKPARCMGIIKKRLSGVLV